MNKKLDGIIEHLGIEETNIHKEIKKLIVDVKRIPDVKRLKEEQKSDLEKLKDMLIVYKM